MRAPLCIALCLLTAIPGLLTSTAAQARSPQHLQRRRAVEYKKRLSLARHQLRQASNSGNSKLWVTGRRNRALASQIKAKQWRTQAIKARASGQLKRARHLDSRANRLSRAIRRYKAGTESYAGQQDSARQHQHQQRERAVGSPIYRLWGERSTPAELNRTRRSNVSGRLAARRLTMENFTGAKPMRPHEVQRWLAKLPGQGRKTISFSERSGDTVYHWKLKRTGFRHGKPQGYIWSRQERADSAEVVTQFHGTKVSWASRDHGYNRSTVVLHHRQTRRKDGSLAIPAGTLTTLSRESSNDSLRTTVLTETLDGHSRQRTSTLKADGRSERFSMQRAANGQIYEDRVRVAPDGHWKRQIKQYDPRQGLAVYKDDSRGGRRERQVSPQVEQRLFKKLWRVADRPKESIKRYKDGTWSWRHQLPALNGSVGTVAARGKHGLLGRVDSGYTSPLGTTYGAANRTVRRTIAQPQKGARPIKARTYSYTKLGRQKGAWTPPAKGRVTAADQQRLEQSETLVNKVRKRPIRVLKDDMRGEANAFAQPTNNTVYGSTKVIKNVDVANIGSTFARGSKPLQVGVILHEGGHEFQEPRVRDPRFTTHRIQAGNLAAINRQLGATVASLLAADNNRTLERGADRAAGQGLAKVRRVTRDASMTPRDYIKALQQMQKGAPFSRTWSPTQGYDSVRQRSRTTWKAYGAGLRKTK